MNDLIYRQAAGTAYRSKEVRYEENSQNLTGNETKR